MFKGFKDFIMRGNVVDLAVGVVIGAAFTGVVTQFTESFLKPLIKLIGGGSELRSGTWNISGVRFPWVNFVNAAITFLLTAAVLYFLVVFPMNKLAERRQRGEEPPPKAPSEEVKLLTEIRDALLAGNQGTPAQRGALDDVLGRRTEPPAPR
ncbi:large conductance mechanosensitive channel protein MscL [Micromonospora sp. KC721]|uniref:large conductance mechanosensitive channel protein MscL n=1 Tax=Micromonospora sp. KC721 TaxID=2530380 RepID=UPI00104F8954|nr:large conductance mechanosensitive channel protein MscL [Micromonospora sp. KC721]TDB77479.1 large conductance mechanosensitive channel protein MscL [Micromonospora sp. KC721]